MVQNCGVAELNHGKAVYVIRGVVWNQDENSICLRQFHTLLCNDIIPSLSAWIKNDKHPKGTCRFLVYPIGNLAKPRCRHANSYKAKGLGFVDCVARTNQREYDVSSYQRHQKPTPCEGVGFLWSVDNMNPHLSLRDELNLRFNHTEACM